MNSNIFFMVLRRGLAASSEAEVQAPWVGGHEGLGLPLVEELSHASCVLSFDVYWDDSLGVMVSSVSFSALSIESSVCFPINSPVKSLCRS